ncbi:siderophore-interacting protein [Gordonia soli]|nr:siderophore-interacting protein [Gordonia soli]
MGYSFARVTATEDLNPRLRRVRLDVADPDALGLPDQGDEAVGIYFPTDGRRPPEMENRDGAWGYFDEPIPPGRNYSVRALDPATREMVVDFVIHDHGVATTWAREASIDDEVVLAHGRGWYRPPTDAAWQLLVADLAGLPALARIIEELPTGTAATAIVEVVDESDLDYLPRRDDVEVRAVIEGGNGHGASALPSAVADFDHPEGPGYCWFAAEASASRAVRKQLRREFGWQREQYDIIGYWRFDGEAWAKRYAEHGTELLEVYQRAIADGKGEKAASEEFDAALERAGL